MAGSHLVAFDPQTIPYEKIITWFKAPDKEDDVYVSGSDDHGFRLDDLSGMNVTGAIAERGHGYYAENRVVYLCMDRGHGQGIVEGTSRLAGCGVLQENQIIKKEVCINGKNGSL